jgi:hypothetical protein
MFTSSVLAMTNTLARLHLNDNKTIVRIIEQAEAKQYFSLHQGVQAQKEYIVNLFNEKYQASQFTAADYAAAQRPISVNEERFLSLENKRKINALPTEEEHEYQELKAKLYSYDY